MSATARYFAYGPLMRERALRRLVGPATLLGRARLAGWRFVCNQMGAEGSAKANVTRAPEHDVWGALYELPRVELHRLDSHALGYERRAADVERDEGGRLDCELHASVIVDERRLPFEAYVAELVGAARELGLPDAYVAMLAALPRRPNALPGCRCR
jgi:gamma-glutamylcyclotransferase (GGCT)/AIG2-like uncharacterized protein YtfP